LIYWFDFNDVIIINDVDEQEAAEMEMMTLFLTIMTCLVCGALAAAFFGSRPTTFEQAVAAELGSSSDKMRTSDSKKRKRKHPTTKKTGSKKSGLEESDDDSMADEDAVVGLLHARGINVNVKATETTGSNHHSPRAAPKGPSKSKTDDARAVIGSIFIHLMNESITTDINKDFGNQKFVYV